MLGHLKGGYFWGFQQKSKRKIRGEASFFLLTPKTLTVLSPITSKLASIFGLLVLWMRGWPGKITG